METLKQRLLEHIADLLDEPTFDMDMRLRDCIDPLPNYKSELHLLMTDAAFKVFCTYFGKDDTTEQCAINGVVEKSEQLKSVDSLDFYNWYKGEGYYSNNRNHFDKHGHGVKLSDLKIAYKEFIAF